MFLFPLIAALVSSVFSLLVFQQYFSRRKPYQLAWAAALLMFAIGAATETVATAQGWNEVLVKIYYIFGATLMVGYLGLGTLYLLKDKPATYLAVISLALTFLLWLPIYGLRMFRTIPIAAIIILISYLILIIFLLLTQRRIGYTFFVALILTSIVAIWLILNASVNLAELDQTQGWKALERTLPIKSAAFSLNVLGSFIVIFGAIYSAWGAWRQKVTRERAIANILIAAGVLIVASGGTLGGLLGLGGQAALSVPMAIGVTVMFVGFLQAGRPPKTIGN